MSLRLAFLVLGGVLSACGGAQNPERRDYGDDAREAYEDAMEDFRSENCLDAEPAFRRVRREYPFSRFAALSELRVADCMFIQGKYTEAIAAYRQFARTRPSHGKVSYARFKMAESYYKQIPDEWLLSPPSHELDQAPTRESLRQVRRFILDYPDDDLVDDAQEMVKKSLGLLARHELYVAEFYLENDHPRAAIIRLRALLRTYEGSGVEPKALLILGRTHLQMRERDKARRAFHDLVERFPRSSYVEQAQSYLRRMARR